MAWAPDYVLATALRSYLRIDDTDDDVEIALAITAASRAVDRAAHRQFGQVDAAEDRTYVAEWDRRRARWVVSIDDLQAATDLVVTVDAGAINSFTLEPLNAAQLGRPYELLVVGLDSAVSPIGGEHQVTLNSDLWGWAAVPEPVEQATLIQAARFFKRRDAPFGVAGSPDLGSELRLLAKVDPDVAVVLSSYQRWWAAA